MLSLLLIDLQFVCITVYKFDFLRENNINMYNKEMAKVNRMQR